jgi:stage II sporulation protein P
MIGRRNALPPKNDIPALSGTQSYDQHAYGVSKAKKLKRWYAIYLFTTLSVVCLTVLLLIGTNKQGNAAPWLERAASAILSRELMDLSGNASPVKDDLPSSSSEGIFNVISGILRPSGGSSNAENVQLPGNDPPLTAEVLYAFDYSKVPEGEIAIIPMDLSLASNGSTYIYNSTGYSPDTAALLAAPLSSASQPEYVSASTAPLVLILHTHGTESYSESGAISYLDDGSEIARSEDVSENVVAVGAIMAQILSQNGIPTLHCTIMHDQIQYKDSYARAEDTIRQYLEKYPSIKLVIDLHRDAVVKSTGELVRPVTLVDSQPTAQLMCVVGSDWGGEACPNWEKNLSLALKLRDALNSKYENLCRPAYLRPSTYNQELAPCSLLLEVGACGNSLAEAQRAAALAAVELIPLIKQL